jgi:glycosyltransferase involved in cell wall biosynthesis
MVPGPQRTAIVHEWVSSRAGSEKVFEALSGMWREADLYALSVDPSVPMEFGGRPVRTTFLDRPTLRNKRAVTLPFMPLAWQLVGRHKYDTVITSHHAFAGSNALTQPDGRHFVYVHTPARYVWTPELDGRGASRALTPVRAVLKLIDRRSVAGMHKIAANSRAVADRIERFWGRSAQVIHPPIDSDFFKPGRDDAVMLNVPDNFLLGFGRWIPYKNMDVVIRIAEKAGIPAVIAGRGPEKDRLIALAAAATVPVKIIESPSADEVRELYRRADALLFPTFEDFGLVPVEAMACGTPVIALNKGGAAETVIDGQTGALVEEHDVDAYANAWSRALDVSPEQCRNRANKFSSSAFIAHVTDWTKVD